MCSPPPTVPGHPAAPSPPPPALATRRTLLTLDSPIHGVHNRSKHIPIGTSRKPAPSERCTGGAQLGPRARPNKRATAILAWQPASRPSLAPASPRRLLLDSPSRRQPSIASTASRLRSRAASPPEPPRPHPPNAFLQGKWRSSVVVVGLASCGGRFSPGPLGTVAGWLAGECTLLTRVPSRPGPAAGRRKAKPVWQLRETAPSLRGATHLAPLDTSFGSAPDTLETHSLLCSGADPGERGAAVPQRLPRPDGRPPASQR